MNFIREILRTLERDGLLLESDPGLPSIASIIAGEPIRGSWWGHKAGKVIYNTCETLIDRGDILRLKLLNGKVTYVHSSLWPELVKVATSKAPWQMDGLSPSARKLLKSVEKSSRVRADEAPAGLAAQDARAAAKELESRLLVLSCSVHTDSGAHVKALQSWDSWMSQVGIQAKSTEMDTAYAAIEGAARKIGVEPRKRALPWTWM